MLYSVVILLNDGGDYKTVNLDEVLQLVDSLIGLVEIECGMNTNEDEYEIPDEDSPEYEKFQMFLEWLVIINKLYERGKYGHLKTLRNYLKRKNERQKMDPYVRMIIEAVFRPSVISEDIQRKYKVALTEKQRSILEKLAKGTNVKLNHKERAKIIIASDEGLNHSEVAIKLGINRNTVRKWVRRWLEIAPEINLIEIDKPYKLRKLIESVLEDSKRPGAPKSFTDEQTARIINLATERPEKYNIPADLWSLSLLVQKAVELGYVESISKTTVWRMFCEFLFKPHQVKEWMFRRYSLKDKSFNVRVDQICKLYLNAKELSSHGIEVVCADECCGIQAITFKYSPVLAKMGGKKMLVDRSDYESKGTTGILAARFVTTGQVVTMVQRTRTEEDFGNLIEEVIGCDRSKRYIIILDQLNTHMSETLVKISAQYEGIDPQTLGVKGKSGIMKSMKTRMEFLSNPDRHLMFVYTPLHCSWMNQVEVFFSILKRRILTSSSSYTSVEELEHRIEAFIAHYNKYLAKPYMWKFKGFLKIKAA